MTVSLRSSPSAAAGAAGLLVVVLACVGRLLLPSSPSSAFEIGSCTEVCGNSGCVENYCLPSCQFLTDPEADNAILRSLPFYRSWKERICSTECQYLCLLSNETEAAGFKQTALGFREDWCLIRVFNHEPETRELYTSLARASLTTWGPNSDLMNEPTSVVLSIVNLVGTIVGLLGFLRLVLYNMPTRPISKGPYYPFAGLWTIYGLLIALYWVAQGITHYRNMALDIHIDVSSEIVGAVISLLLTVLRVGDIRSEQARVIVLAPMVAFLVPHLMYINTCYFNYGLNTMVCLGLYTIQHLLLVVWATVYKHPAKVQLWSIAALASLMPLLRIFNFSNSWAILDVDSLWILAAIPSTILWWNFVKVDAAHMTSLILKQRDETVKKDA